MRIVNRRTIRIITLPLRRRYSNKTGHDTAIHHVSSSTATTSTTFAVSKTPVHPPPRCYDNHSTTDDFARNVRFPSGGKIPTRPTQHTRYDLAGQHTAVRRRSTTTTTNESFVVAVATDHDVRYYDPVQLLKVELKNDTKSVESDVYNPHTPHHHRIQDSPRPIVHLSYTNTTSGSSSVPETIQIHPAWLWCHDPTYIHETSGQHLRTHRMTLHSYYHRNIQIQSVQIIQRDSTTTTTTSDDSSNNNVSPSDVVIPMPPSPGSLHSRHTTTAMRTHPAPPPTCNPPRSLLHVVWNQHDDDDHLPTHRIDSYYDVTWIIRCQHRPPLPPPLPSIEMGRRVRDNTAIPLMAPCDTEPHGPMIVVQDIANHSDMVPKCYHYNELKRSSIDHHCQEANDHYHHHDDNTATLSGVGCYQLLDAVFQTGAVLVQEVPLPSHPDDATEDHILRDDHDSPVAKIGRTLGGRLSHGQLYGDVFHVRDKTKPSLAKKNNDHRDTIRPGTGETNIAYTTLALCPHQDLAYYESIPGLQLLHCIENDVRTIQGGASTLIDAIAAATEFQKCAPDLWDSLTYYEATFIKQRDGADMIYRRPHIQYSSSEKCVTSVRWSPPFEGPPLLWSLSPQQMDEYYVAYSAFERMIDNALPRLHTTSDHITVNRLLPRVSYELEIELCNYADQNTWEYRLQRGDLLIFNNQRMLHGRRAYTKVASPTTKSSSAGRHLMGCYTNIDDTLNQYRLLRRNYYQKQYELPYLPIVGNGSSSVP